MQYDESTNFSTILPTGNSFPQVFHSLWKQITSVTFLFYVGFHKVFNISTVFNTHFFNTLWKLWKTCWKSVEKLKVFQQVFNIFSTISRFVKKSQKFSTFQQSFNSPNVENFGLQSTQLRGFKSFQQFQHPLLLLLNIYTFIPLHFTNTSPVDFWKFFDFFKMYFHF